MMENKQRLFLIQFMIAALFFVLLANIVSSSFIKDPEGVPFLALNEDLNTMAKSREALLDSLIAINNLTIDPSDGNDIDRVLNNLKYSKKEKLLIVGSSQLIVVQGEEYWKSRSQVVSTKIEYLTNDKYQTYNLSMGGMTAPEKLLIANKAASILQPQNIIIAMTPWDSGVNKTRPTLQAIEKNTYKTQDEIKDLNKASLAKEEFKFPITFNNKISAYLEGITKEKSILYSKRTGIQKWLKYKTDALFGSHKVDTLTIASEVTDELKPEYWSTNKQELNDITGWDSIAMHSGKKSLKISNANPQNALWLGDPIYLDTPSKTFNFEAYSKAENIGGNITFYAFYLGVTFEDGSETQFYNNLSFSKEDHDWQKVNTTITFDKNVVSLRPFLLFYGGTGTVWFDDVKITQGDDDSKSENLVPNAGAEDKSLIRKNAAYLYSQADWQLILLNMKNSVDFLAAQNKEFSSKSALLITPFWHYNNKLAYPQIKEYRDLIENIKAYCTEKNVRFIDASYILSAENFGIYKNGEDKDKIDVLHFNENGHNKLALYIIDQLDL
ncbi:SGNH/GDSL hydrolase family protein [Aequorivita antarctica]|uniref:SGNH/GDSL hydrolase family protein n=1 Tax=Aequorivita antarctica TaxID=153266 RepID=A0A5C6Z5N4_9FLAO|nr:SGNH/GDSL hydrolase family protein [Aequorivita antarctica]TXD74782.1 SGNH/GDSL hydrolase family protein [Aequorivita antarctica]SRX72516.1 hypothetical protein AEQU3_00338 [Aequorivita antarctica]